MPKIEMSLRLSIATSLLSKIASSALHILAMPVAATSLGAREFSLYVMISAFLSWLMIAGVGLGPSVTVQVAEKRGRGEVKELSAVFNSSVFLTLLASTVIVVGVFLWTSFFDSYAVFGAEFRDRSREIENSLRIVAVIVFFQLNSSIFEATQLGLQRQYFNNVANIGGVLSAVITLFLCSGSMENTSDLLLALYIPQIVWRIINCAQLLVSEPQLRALWRGIDRRRCKYLLSQGIRFSAAGPLNNFLSHALPIYLIGLLCLPAEAASYAITINALIISSGILAMCCSPFIPILVDGVSRGDQEKVRIYSRKLVLFSAAATACISISFYFFGAFIFKAWYQNTIPVSQHLINAFCIYFVALAFEVTMYAVLVGLGCLERISTLMTLKAISGAVICCLVLAPGREYWPYLIFAALILLMEVVPFIGLLRKSFAGFRYERI